MAAFATASLQDRGGIFLRQGVSDLSFEVEMISMVTLGQEYALHLDTPWDTDYGMRHRRTA